jgi:hypothetical protein
MAQFISIGDTWGLALVHCKLGWIAVSRHDQQGAHASFTESLSYAQKVGYREGVADVLVGLANVAGMQGAWADAARLLSSAAVILESLAEIFNTLDRDQYDQALARARSHLRDAAFVAAWEEARSRSLEALLTPIVKTRTLDHQAAAR